MSILNWTHRRWAIPALLLCTTVTLAGEATPQEGGGSGAELTALLSNGQRPYSEMWLEVRVNERAMARPAHMVRMNDGRLLACADDLLRWRIRLPEATPLSVRGEDYFPLDTVAGLTHQVDERTQVLLVQARPEAFLSTRINARDTHYAPPDPPSGGAFLNYDLQYQIQEGEHRLDSLFEVGLFNDLGFGTSTFLDHRLQEHSRLLRLETAWTYDQPLSLHSLRLGDSISRPGAWGRAVRYAGVQWGTDFTIRPDYIPFPMPTLAGEADLPSTLDLYVDNALRLSGEVSPGPFTITDVPVVTGQGEVRLVVRDLLGREQVITQPYYASSDLLRSGLQDYTYEAGLLRRKFAVESGDYGSFFAAGTYRAGLTDSLTGELRAEWMASQQTAGGGLTLHWPAVGIVDLAAAVSHGPDGGGGLFSIGLERQGRPFSFSLRSQVASDGFIQIGGSQSYRPPRQLTLARANLATGAGGSTFVSYVHQAGPTQPDLDLVSVGYSVNLFGSYFLSLFAVRALDDEPVDSFGLNITHALGPRTTASASWTRQDEASTPSFQLQQSLPQGSGYGYRLASTGGTYERQDATLLMQNDIGSYSIEASRVGDMSGQRVSASGGVALLGGSTHLSRRLDDSFAVVKVGGYPNVPVFADNHVVAQTDASGSALVPALRAYEENRISIRQDALPLDAQMDRMSLSVTPRRRSGSLVEFPVHTVHGALLRIVLDDGSPLPAGAVVRIEGGEEAFPVARRGEAYVTGLGRYNELQASWKGRQCSLQVTLPPDAGPLPVLGPLVCHGVLP